MRLLQGQKEHPAAMQQSTVAELVLQYINSFKGLIHVLTTVHSLRLHCSGQSSL
jgi:hypothetical protein